MRLKVWSSHQAGCSVCPCHPQPRWEELEAALSLAVSAQTLQLACLLPISDPRGEELLSSPRAPAQCPLPRNELGHNALQSSFLGFFSLGALAPRVLLGILPVAARVFMAVTSPQPLHPAFPGLRAWPVPCLSAFCPTHPGSLSFSFSFRIFCRPEDEPV